jgi:hypothetical protein
MPPALKIPRTAAAAASGERSALKLPVGSRKELDRRIGNARWSHLQIAEFFQINPTQANALIGEMVARGFLDHFEQRPGDITRFYQCGPQGPRLASALLLKPITRAKAEAIIAAFLQRVESVNARPVSSAGTSSPSFLLASNCILANDHIRLQLDNFSREFTYLFSIRVALRPMIVDSDITRSSSVWNTLFRKPAIGYLTASSARASSRGAAVMPRALAELRLIGPQLMEGRRGKRVRAPA